MKPSPFDMRANRALRADNIPDIDDYNPWQIDKWLTDIERWANGVGQLRPPPWIEPVPIELLVAFGARSDVQEIREAIAEGDAEWAIYCTANLVASLMRTKADMGQAVNRSRASGSRKGADARAHPARDIVRNLLDQGLHTEQIRDYLREHHPRHITGMGGDKLMRWINDQRKAYRRLPLESQKKDRQRREGET